MKVSVIIATVGRTVDLIKTLKAIEENSIKPFELLIIDQGNIKSAKLKCINLNILLIKIDKKSSAQARNIGIELVKGDIISFLDDDVILDRNYFKEILKSFEESSQVKIIQGKITNFKDREILNLFLGIFLGAGSFKKSNYVRVYNFENIFYKSYLNSEQFCMWASGCNMNVRKEVFCKEKFDSQLIRYSSGEDLDFSYRVYKRFGEKSILFQPKARLKHNNAPIGRLAKYDLMLMRRVHKLYFSYKNYKKERNAIQTVKNMWYIFGCLIFNILKIFKGDYKSFFYFFAIEYQVLLHRQDIKNLNIEWMNIKLFNEKSIPKAKVIKKVNTKIL